MAIDQYEDPISHGNTTFRYDGACIYLYVFNRAGGAALAHGEVACLYAAVDSITNTDKITVAKVGSGYNTPGSTNFHKSAEQKVIGVASGTINANAYGWVCVMGITDCAVDGTVVAGKSLKLSPVDGKANEAPLAGVTMGDKLVFCIAYSGGTNTNIRANIMFKRY